ncbi:MAG: DUF4388 domain-containing protein [Desulfomonile tiedjei]|nr:DUF4388 domain-containing protein [Desulfomonile tiedjei]
MADADKRIVAVSSRLTKFIGAKATKEKKMQAAAMQAEFTLRDTLIILCYLGRDPDPEISSQARKNLIPAARNWFNRPDKPELPEPIYEIVMKVIDRIGGGEAAPDLEPQSEAVSGNIGLFGLGEILQSIDHNNRTSRIALNNEGETATIYTERGRVVGAVTDDSDGMEAFFTAFGWSGASFEYQLAEPGEFRNRIKASTLNLVMDALDRMPDHDPFDSDISRTWRIQGNLGVMNIFEIAEIFEMNSKQAVCRMTREGVEGSLFFKSGRVANATLGEMTGLDAACYLLAWPSAQFAISRGEDEVPDVIHVGMQNLIIEAMRLLDEGVTVTERIASELALINELFEGRDVVTLPVLEKVRLVFSDDQRAREVLETDSNPLVRKAIRVKISKTVHKYLNPATDHEIRMKAARGVVPLSTNEKLVLLSYLSHDESVEIREQAKKTLDELDMPTYRKGLEADLHPSVVDFLVRETIKDPALISVAASSDNILEETALHILENWSDPQVFRTISENKKLLERSPSVAAKIKQMAPNNEELQTHIDAFEESLLQGQFDLKVEGPLNMVGLGGLFRAARQGNRSGTIVVERPGQVGRIFLRRGKVIGALCGDLEGMPALEDILRHADHRFRYTLRTNFHVENLDNAAVEEILTRPSLGPSSGEHEGLRLISGSLVVMDVFEVLSSLEGTSVPIAITVIAEEGLGEIVRDRSHILHVRVEGKDSPLQAMAAMMSWNGTRFVARKAADDLTVTVDKPANDFFADAMRLIPDEMKYMTRPGELPEWELAESEFESLYHRILQMGVTEKIKCAMMGTKEARDILVRDSNKLVAVAVVKSPKIQESEIEAISKSRNVSEEVLRHIASNNDWTKSYTVKHNLCANSKTPIPIAMKFLNHLREMDLRRLARSKNVSSVVATQARRIAETKKSRV